MHSAALFSCSFILAAGMAVAGSAPGRGEFWAEPHHCSPGRLRRGFSGESHFFLLRRLTVFVDDDGTATYCAAVHLALGCVSQRLVRPLFAVESVSVPQSRRPRLVRSYYCDSLKLRVTDPGAYPTTHAGELRNQYAKAK
jgi:hypothetical protein